MTRQSRRPSRRALRTALLATSLAATAVAVMALLPGPVLADSTSGAIFADRQNYVSNTGTDAWQSYQTAFSGQSPAPDSTDIHVGASPDQPTYTSYLRLSLDSIPEGASISSLKVTLHPTDDQLRQQENVNVGTSNTNCQEGTLTQASCTPQPNDAVMDAYPLKVPYPDKFPDSNSPSSAPEIDVHGPEAVGSFNGKDASWTFELAEMVPYWKKHGNTGFAIVPDAAAAAEPWQVGFDKNSTEGQSEYTLTGQSSLLQSTLFQPSTTGSAPQLGSLSLSPKAPSLGANAVPRSPTFVTKRVLIPAAPPKGWVPIWALVLAGSFAAAVALLAHPVSTALAGAGGALSGLTGQLRLHPRMFGVAAVLLVWSSTLAVYGNTLGRQAFSPTVVSETVPGTGASGTAAAGPGGGPGGAAAAAGGSAAAAGGSASSQLYPNSPNPPSANLFTPDQERIGLTDSTIQLCAHAALTFGPAFNIGASDLNVFWTMINKQGGVWGRKLVQPNGAGDGIAVQDDGYQPSKAVTAAQACEDQPGGDFFLLGGIGFDQIPAVRVWAEQHHMLYIHHIALQAGSDGLRYSFTMLPTLEAVGQQYAQYYISKHAGQKIGIIERNSSNWEAGANTFKQALDDAGYGDDIVVDDKVNNNQGQYSSQIADLSSKGAQVVLIWENALAAENIIQQADKQSYHPYWIGFPFNLTLYTLAQSGMQTQFIDKYSGMVPWPAYTCYASKMAQYQPYSAEIREFEAAYAKYDSGANLCGDGGDLLFGTWEAWRQVYDLLYQCGRDCTRDKIAGLMLSGFHDQVGANCAVDFSTGDHHHGGFDEDVYSVGPVVSVADPNNSQHSYSGPIWVTDQPTCRRTIS